MSEVSTDRAANLKWVARKGDTKVLRINFSTTQAAREFTAIVMRYPATTLFTLSEANGKIVNNGTYINITIDSPNADNHADTYRWVLRDDTDFTWIDGPFILNDEPGTPASAEGTVTVNTGSTEVTLDLTIAPTDHYRGVYASLVALQTAIPTGNPGDYADVDAGVGTDIIRYIWDDDDDEWIRGGASGSFADLTGVPGDNAALAAALALKQALVNSATALVDGATIDLTAIKHTLSTAASRTFTISYTGDDITLEITLSATSATQTFPATALCVSEGTASGDNTLSMSGVSGDKYVIAIKKVGSAYYVVGKNFGQ